MKIKYIVKIIVYVCIAMSLQTTYTWASQYGPCLLFHKPYSATPYLSSYFMSFVDGKTSNAFDQQGNTVPFLQEYGSEDLLKRFIDPSLGRDNIESMGQGQLSGTYQFKQLCFSYYKNIHHGLFFGISTSIQDINLSSISINFQSTEFPLSNEQIAYLDALKTIIPTNINTSGIFASSIVAGYNKVFTDFEHLDFLQIFLKGEISAPQWMHNTNRSMLQYPLAANITFGYPMIGIISLGILKHINFGLYGLILPFQRAQQLVPVNRTSSHNQILFTEATVVKINPKPLFSTAFYMEVHDFIPGLIGTIGYGYAYGMNWTITPLNQRDFPSENINRTSVLDSWNISSILFQLDYCMQSESRPHAPFVSFYYILPIAGKLYPKINILGGAYNLVFTYNF